MGDDFFGETDILASLSDSNGEEYDSSNLDIVNSEMQTSVASDFGDDTCVVENVAVEDSYDYTEEIDTASKDEFDFDKVFQGGDFDALTEEDFVVDSDVLAGGEDGEIIVLAVASEGSLVYLCHGTAHRLKDVAGYLDRVLGGNLVRIPLDGEDIETLKDDSNAFESAFRKYVEG